MSDIITTYLILAILYLAADVGLYTRMGLLSSLSGNDIPTAPNPGRGVLKVLLTLAALAGAVALCSAFRASDVVTFVVILSVLLASLAWTSVAYFHGHERSLRNGAPSSS